VLIQGLILSYVAVSESLRNVKLFNLTGISMFIIIIDSRQVLIFQVKCGISLEANSPLHMGEWPVSIFLEVFESGHLPACGRVTSSF
jgi:hypothetical protein